LQRPPITIPQKHPYLATEFGVSRIPALIYTGAIHSAISVDVYKSLLATGYTPLKVRLAFKPYTDTFKRGISLVTKKVLLEFKIDGEVFQQYFRIRKERGRLSLGDDFMQKNQIIIDLHKGCLRKGNMDERRRFGFCSTKGETVGEAETNADQSDNSTDALLPNINSTQPSLRTEPKPQPSRQKPDLGKHPYKFIEFGDVKILAALVTGLSASVISERAFKCITPSCHKCLDLTSRPVYIEAGGSATIAKMQVLLEFKIDGDVFKTLFWVTKSLFAPVILGADFLKEKSIAIDFRENCFRRGEKEYNKIYKFIPKSEFDKIRFNGNGVEFWPL
jgi:hypothetical protein